MEHETQNSLTSKREIVVAFRLTPAEAARIDAAGAGLRRPRRRADFCRAAALHLARQRVPEPCKPIRLPPKRLPALDTQLLSRILGELGKIGGNVNLIAHAANATRASPATSTLTAIAEDIAAARNAVVAVLKGEPNGAITS